MRGSARSLHEVELLADELNWLAGWGMKPKRLALMHVTRELAQVDPSLPQVTAGCLVGRYIVEATTTMEGGTLEGREYDAHTMRRAVRLQLGIDQSHALIPARHYRLMQVLGRHDSEPAWRKDPLRRRALLVLLAEHMVEQAFLVA